MKVLSVGLLLAVLPVFGGQQGATLAPVALYTQFQQQPSETVLQTIRQELATIMTPMGLRFEWRSLASAQGSEVSVELAVISFKGYCDVAHLAPHFSHPGPLGWTHVSEGTILPFSDVDCDGIRSFLQNGLLAVRGPEREQLFGRAVARVLAHELYHILANTQHHGAGGVAKAAYTVENLLAADFTFDEKESNVLINSKAYEILSDSK